MSKGKLTNKLPKGYKGYKDMPTCRGRTIEENNADADYFNEDNEDFEKKAKKRLASLDKDTIIELYLQKCFDEKALLEHEEMLLEHKAIIDETLVGYANKCKQLIKQLKFFEDRDEKNEIQLIKQAEFYRGCLEEEKQYKIQSTIEMLEEMRSDIKTIIDLAEDRLMMDDQVDIIFENQIAELKKDQVKGE